MYGQKYFKNEVVVSSVLEEGIITLHNLISEGHLLLQKYNEKRIFETKVYHCFGYSIGQLIKKYYILPGPANDSVVLLARHLHQYSNQYYFLPLEMIINVDIFYLRNVL